MEGELFSRPSGVEKGRAWARAQKLSKSRERFHPPPCYLPLGEGEPPLAISKSKCVSFPEVLHLLWNQHTSCFSSPRGKESPAPPQPAVPRLRVTPSSHI